MFEQPDIPQTQSAACRRAGRSARWNVAAAVAAAALLIGPSAPAGAQGAPPRPPLGDGPWEFMTFENGGTPIRVTVVTKGLNRPWSMVWLPNGDMLISERAGAIRHVRNGRLVPDAVAGLDGLAIDRFFDLALHPDFAANGLVYMTYIKTAPHPRGGSYWATTALARGRFDGSRLHDVADVFIADAWRELSGGDGSRILFAPDGTLFMASSHRRDPTAPQLLNDHVGKILRLNDDGSPAAGNPFVGRGDARPEIWSLGHRTTLGLTFHPATGALWQTENGPQGGDEVNVILPGRNYGWPVTTYGRDYSGVRVTDTPVAPGFEAPELFWVPSIAASGLTFYTGAEIPAWQGNLFTGAMTVGRIPGTGRLERIVFAANGGELRRESLLADLHQRIRDVRQGPDGRLYLLTDETDGALLVIESAR